MSMSPPPLARASLTTTANLARNAGRAIAASTAGRVRRIAWLTGAAASSLVAACGSAPPATAVTFSVCSSSSTALPSVLPVRAVHGVAGVTP